MGKLHQLIAVDKKLTVTADDAIGAAIEKFNSPSVFTGHIKTLKMFSDEDSARAEEEAAFEDVKVAHTVTDCLSKTFEAIEKDYDAIIQKDEANQRAKADIVIDGKTIAKNVPATTLLTLKKRLGKISLILETIPTLNLSVKWEEISGTGEGIYTADNFSTTTKTEKIVDKIIKVEATEKHPAQAELINRSIVVGKYTTKYFSGMISPADKQGLLKRLAELSRATAEALSRANGVEVSSVKIGESIIDYLKPVRSLLG